MEIRLTRELSVSVFNESTAISSILVANCAVEGVRENVTNPGVKLSSMKSSGFRNTIGFLQDYRISIGSLIFSGISGGWFLRGVSWDGAVTVCIQLGCRGYPSPRLWL